MLSSKSDLEFLLDRYRVSDPLHILILNNDNEGLCFPERFSSMTA